MSIVEMQKIHIVALLNYQDQILKSLEKNEVLDIQTISEPTQLPSFADELGNKEYELAEIKSTISFLEKVKQEKRSFMESFVPPKEEMTEEQFQKSCREFDCTDFVRQCDGYEDELSNLKNLKTELINDRARLLPWTNLNTSLNTLTCSIKTCLVLGKIKTRQFVNFKNNLENLSKAVEVEIVSQTKEETYLIITHLAAEKELFTPVIAKSSFETISLPITDKTPAQEIDRINSMIKETDQEIQETLIKVNHLARHLEKIKFMYDHVLGSKASLEIKQKLADTNYTFVIEGWIKKAELAKIKENLLNITNELEIYEIEPAKDEKPPVALQNPRVLSPFELITNIYGTPKHNEWDPSLALAFFFALFFGICLGDFGYGLILAAISIYFLKRYRLPEGGKKLFRLLLFGGGVAAIVGMLTGSYLGFSPNAIPTTLLPLKHLLSRIQIIDPIKSPLIMLVFSLALGVVQILFGIILQMALRIKNKEYVSAILDDGIWFFFLSSLVFLIVSSALGLETVKIASNMSIGGAVALVLTQGRHKKNIFAKFFSGLLSLYKVSGYMGDTLSYSRLLALGMSTTIIGSVINILAGMVKGGIPILGVVLMIVLLIFGHLFNLIIGTLGAFVHSTRLQMVEFFSKFYEGGGREFQPYKRQAEYTIIK